ncbi:MAG: DAK2 domain-containing protein [Anaerolineae bacterium]|nr:MAG: DAK2 domain-containing protein [Anaerolineae bacterium]
MTIPSSNPRLSRRLAMERFPIDGQAVKNLAWAGLEWLKTNQQTVNALNVFPVPDGDTGTNMILTMKKAYEEIEKSPEKHAGKMLAKLAQGALMGARGNSGVILSQLWRGVAHGMEHEEAITGKALARALANARDTAYKGVVKPVEGTILTVSKDLAAAAEKRAATTDNAVEVLEAAVAEAAASVERTPDLLPILKEAGVVDSGGKGLFFLLDGMLRWINGEDLDTPVAGVQPLASLNFDSAMDAVEEGQDYEVVVDFRPHKPLDIASFYAGLEDMGTSIQVGEGEGMYRMHIHVPTENRYKPIDYCIDLGTVTNVAIENLMAQMDDIGAAAQQRIEVKPIKANEIAVVAVAPGPGIARTFASLGVAALVEGGQTMNPSTQDILTSFENLPTNKVIILPNNKNIILAAEQAAGLTVKQVKVVKSRSVPQGLSAMLRMLPDGDLDEVAADMESALGDVECGEITTATRDVELDGVQVKNGSIIALHNGKLIISDPSLETAMLGLLEGMGADDLEILTLFYGASLRSDEAEAIVAAIAKKYPALEVELHEGGQPHYMFILSAE